MYYISVIEFIVKVGPDVRVMKLHGGLLGVTCKSLTTEDFIFLAED